jgi:hypothetical protein
VRFTSKWRRWSAVSGSIIGVNLFSGRDSEGLCSVKFLLLSETHPRPKKGKSHHTDGRWDGERLDIAPYENHPGENPRSFLVLADWAIQYPSRPSILLFRNILIFHLLLVL